MSDQTARPPAPNSDPPSSGPDSRNVVDVTDLIFENENETISFGELLERIPHVLSADRGPAAREESAIPTTQNEIFPPDRLPDADGVAVARGVLISVLDEYVQRGFGFISVGKFSELVVDTGEFSRERFFDFAAAKDELIRENVISWRDGIGAYAINEARVIALKLDGDPAPSTAATATALETAMRDELDDDPETLELERVILESVSALGDDASGSNLAEEISRRRPRDPNDPADLLAGLADSMRVTVTTARLIDDGVLKHIPSDKYETGIVVRTDVRPAERDPDNELIRSIIKALLVDAQPGNLDAADLILKTYERFHDLTGRRLTNGRIPLVVTSMLGAYEIEPSTDGTLSFRVPARPATTADLDVEDHLGIHHSEADHDKPAHGGYPNA